MREPYGMAHDVLVSRKVATTALLAAPVSADTATFVDETGDVEIWDKDPVNPLAEAIDLEAVTISASARTVRVTLQVADVLTMSEPS
jgi:hypothetical protein